MNEVKRIISVLVALLLCFSVLPLFSVTSGATLYMRGDADRNLTVDAADSLLMRRCVAGIVSDVPCDGGDVDGDGKVSARDVFYLKVHFVNGTDLEALFPDGKVTCGFRIAGKSIDGYEIVVTNPDNENMVFAAEELAKYVKEGDGSDLSIVNVPTGCGKIVLSEDTEGIYGSDGFNLSVRGGDLYITAGSLRGSMYAVYTLLEDYYGWRFFGYGEKTIVRCACDIPEGCSDTQIPSVLCRCNCIDSFGDRYTYDSVLKNKLSGSTSHWSQLCAKYGYGIERLFANAHSFDVFISKSPTHCLSNEANYQTCLENMENLIEEKLAAGWTVGKEITQISCSYAADEKYCTCSTCSAKYSGGRVKNRITKQYDEYEREGSYAGVLVQFVNRIDDALTAKYPGITVVTNAYGIVRKPPLVSVLNDDVVLLYCWNACTNHLIGSGDCTGRTVGDTMVGSNKVDEEFFAGWKEHSSRIFIWYYPTNIYYLLCPHANFFKIYDDFMWFASQGVEGYYVVGSVNSSFEELDAYLINLLMWDDGMTREEFDNYTFEYLKNYYGYGWTYIYEYMKMLRECASLKSCVLNDYEQPFDTYSKEYFRDNFGKMQELFECAKEYAMTDSERHNLEKLSVHMKFLGYSATYERDYVMGDTESRAAFEKGWRETYDFINRNGIRVSYDRTGIDTPFTLDVSPMMLVYGIEGER